LISSSLFGLSARVSASASRRIGEARAWLAEKDPAGSLLIVAPSLQSGARLVHGVGEGEFGCFGWHRETVSGLVDKLSQRAMAEAGLAAARGLAQQALCARVIEQLADRGELGPLTRVADRPGMVTRGSPRR